jgi:hypothetical protein
MDFDKESAIDAIIQSAFFVQLLVLSIAKTQDLTDCHFLRNRKLLRLSSDFIYG